ncbi:hypothetical protein HRW18_25165 [Streptomyces lunaelactis]|uniref:hypothetical protein n=1 Tax=Streptomyces lunaelactis TaxID=1535768 RepID=UPI001584AFE3|nr:hypothetical protein [Streptomyces lunaelactis]NUK04323.1 hypothetical protein [Streptomyces lunaelactis]NUK11209.1 hypothetical protein [Streptomyces lunaelactis]NUK18772.1 hypothetical protein [Streptomyces lunaelactis]NUK36011.1 hypothetical protein [Streptomyces lunaelactis]NUK44247.1 hypothetical protein [Streptomyces lunaelactis]
MNDAPALHGQVTDPALPVPARRDRQWHRPAYIGLTTLLPTAVVAWLPALMSERFGRCLTYGEQCARDADMLGTVAWYAFWGSAAAGVAAVIVTSAAGWARRLRKSLVLIQLTLQMTTATAILALA